jgi:hypothetical protein
VSRTASGAVHEHAATIAATVPAEHAGTMARAVRDVATMGAARRPAADASTDASRSTNAAVGRGLTNC